MLRVRVLLVLLTSAQMLETGREMSTKYKETAGGGLAKHTRISTAVTEC